MRDAKKRKADNLRVNIEVPAGCFEFLIFLCGSVVSIVMLSKGYHVGWAAATIFMTLGVIDRASRSAVVRTISNIIERFAPLGKGQNPELPNMESEDDAG